MSEAVRGTWSLLLAVAFLMIGTGLQGTLLGLRAALEDFGSTTTGLVMSSFYLGYMASSFTTPHLIATVGHVRVFAALASVASSAILVHVLFVDPYVWGMIRFISGFALAGLFTVAESWLNGASDDSNRGRILSFYMIIVYVGMGSGQYLLFVADPADFTAFLFVSILVSIALVPLSLAPSPVPDSTHAVNVGLLELYRHSPLGFLSCFLIGAASSALLSMGAVYGSLLGLSTTEVALLMAFPLFGVVATQFPIGVLSDRVDRRWVIFVVSLIVGLCGAALVFVTRSNIMLLVILFTAYGAISAPIYSLAIAHTNDRLEPSKMVGASAMLVLIFGIGSVVGPVLAGVAMTLSGPSGFFLVGSLLHLLLAAIAIVRIRYSDAINPEQRGDFVHVALRASPVAASAAMEEGSSD